MGCPFLASRPKAEVPTEYPYESLYRPWSWILSSFNNLFLFAALVGVLYFLYRRRMARPLTVSYRRVEVKSRSASEQREETVNVLVTGGNGILGSCIVELLLKAGGYCVHVLDLWIPEEKDRDPEVCSYIKADITNIDDMVLAMQGIDAVFHVAGIIPGVSHSDADYYLVNAKGTGSVVDACKHCGVKRLIYTSSITSILSSDSSHDLDGADETTPYPEKPLNAYTGSKASAEKVVFEANGKDGLFTCAMRPAGIISAKKPPIKVKQREDYAGVGLIVSNAYFIPVEYVAQAHILAEQKLRDGPSSVAAGKAYNLCIDEAITYREYSGYDPNASISIWGQPTPRSIPVWVAMAVCHLNRWIYVTIGIAPFSTIACPLIMTFMRNKKQVFCSDRAHRELGCEQLPPWREVIKAFVSKAVRELKKEQ